MDFSLDDDLLELFFVFIAGGAFGVVVRAEIGLNLWHLHFKKISEFFFAFAFENILIDHVELILEFSCCESIAISVLCFWFDVFSTLFDELLLVENDSYEVFTNFT